MGEYNIVCKYKERTTGTYSIAGGFKPVKICEKPRNEDHVLALSAWYEVRGRHGAASDIIDVYCQAFVSLSSVPLACDAVWKYLRI